MVPNIKWINIAAKNLGLDFEIIDDDKCLGVLEYKSNKYFFAHCSTPFNKQDIARILGDKYFFYLVSNSITNCPKTIKYLDPNTSSKFEKYKKYSNLNLILKDINQNFNKEIVIKMNSGERKINVYFPKNDLEKLDALKNIFNQNSKNYDSIAIVQNKIDIKYEFRVLSIYGEVELIYEKWNFNSNISKDIIDRLKIFVQNITDNLNINFAGFDIAIDKNNEIFLIEGNSSPRLELYLKYHPQDEQKIIKIFENALLNFTKKI